MTSVLLSVGCSSVPRRSSRARSGVTPMIAGMQPADQSSWRLDMVRHSLAKGSRGKQTTDRELRRAGQSWTHACCNREHRHHMSAHEWSVAVCSISGCEGMGNSRVSGSSSRTNSSGSRKSQRNAYSLAVVCCANVPCLRVPSLRLQRTQSSRGRTRSCRRTSR